MVPNSHDKEQQLKHLMVVCAVLSLLLAIGVPWNSVKFFSDAQLPQTDVRLQLSSTQLVDTDVNIDLPESFKDVDVPVLDPVTHFPVEYLYGLSLQESERQNDFTSFTSSHNDNECFVLWRNGFFTRYSKACSDSKIANTQDFVTLYRFKTELYQHPEVLVSLSSRNWRTVVNKESTQLKLHFDSSLGLSSLYDSLYLAFYQPAVLLKSARFAGGLAISF